MEHFTVNEKWRRHLQEDDMGKRRTGKEGIAAPSLDILQLWKMVLTIENTIALESKIGMMFNSNINLYLFSNLQALRTK